MILKYKIRSTEEKSFSIIIDHNRVRYSDRRIESVCPDRIRPSGLNGLIRNPGSIEYVLRH